MVLLVTGSSRGIGAATARLAASKGSAVAVNYLHDEEAAARVVADIQVAGGSASAFRADVSNPDQVQALFAQVTRQMGPLQALVNNVGSSVQPTPFIGIAPDSIQQVFATTCFSVFYCVQAAIPCMGRSHGGTGGAIVNVGSEAARFGGNLIAPYAAAKAAIHTLTISLGRELAAEGIRINTVSPGIIATEQHLDLTPDRAARLSQSVPMGRMGTPEEVAEVILWLLSDSASYLTGTVIPVAGGR